MKRNKLAFFQRPGSSGITELIHTFNGRTQAIIELPLDQELLDHATAMTTRYNELQPED